MTAPLLLLAVLAMQTAEAPAAESLSAESPSTESSSTESPSTESSSTESPSTESPSTESSGTESPGPKKDPCQDVYDRSGGCAGLMMEPLEGVGEPLTGGGEAEPEDDEGFLSWLDNDIINWSLLGMSVVAITGATGIHAVSFFYASQLAEQARRGQIGPGALSTTTNIQTALGLGAGAMWITAALFGGTALALWAFDPETGAIRLPFFGE